VSPEARERIFAARVLEHRPEREYSDVDPGHVMHPNHTLVDSEHRGFLGAAGRAVIALHEAQR
jgi:hypothetical protein